VQQREVCDMLGTHLCVFHEDVRAEKDFRHSQCDAFGKKWRASQLTFSYKKLKAKCEEKISEEVEALLAV
jgi:hypothetical protein